MFLLEIGLQVDNADFGSYAKLQRPGGGYARSFVTQMEQVMRLV